MTKVIFRKVELWVVLLIVLGGILASIAFGTIVRNQALGHNRFGKLGEFAYSIASIPATLKKMSRETDVMTTIWGGEARFPGQSGWTVNKNAPLTGSLTGYLLLSRYDGDVRRHMVELVALPSLETRYIWTFDAEAIFADLQARFDHPVATNIENGRFRAIHPVAAENGDLIIKDHFTPAARIDSCGNPLWINPDIFHHSSEYGPDGSIWMPSLITDKPLKGLSKAFQEDGISAVSPEGKTVFSRSLADIFIKNDLGHIITATHSGLDIDPLHLNDIQPVLRDGRHWQRGDLFLSMRHRSALALYRPSTDRILWFKIGPWAFQHDVDILNDHQIAVFSNNTHNLALGPRVSGHNDIVIYDFDTDSVSYPYSDMMAAADVRTISEGLSERMPGNYWLVEEENYGRILIFNADRVLSANYINGAGNAKPYRLGWSRHIDQALGDRIVANVEGVNCE